MIDWQVLVSWVVLCLRERTPEVFALNLHPPSRAGPLLDGASKRPEQWYFDNLLP